jgi:uncharacterized protein YyaL (SSP411 family)
MLSVGYAACHWCHVMERESFEDERIAEILNGSFVCVKVDREERPDIDAVYMEALQAMTGSGGWPMTVFLTPDGEPFYAGTYFPKEERGGMPSFGRVLTSLADAWRERREELVAHGSALVEALTRPIGVDGSSISRDLLSDAHAAMRSSFDETWGGFGGAPKFPAPMSLELLLRNHLHGWEGALEMASATLDAMAAGGMHDQVGGGFHRYSTDERWLVPHFEKMLYDNAQLARTYTQAWLVTRSPRYEEVARSTLDYLLREMRHPEGGFFSSQDADTEGVEGLTFVWSWDELVSLVGEDEARAFGATPQGNFDGANVLHVPDLERAPSQRARAILWDARSARPSPAVDDKILAAWNGLAVSALALAGRSFREPRYVRAAEDAAGFVLGAMRDGGGWLHRSWRDGRAGAAGFLEDHACMASAVLDLWEATFDVRWFEAASELAERILTGFASEDVGVFAMSRTGGTTGEGLVLAPRDFVDNATPSGNSEAALALARMARLTGEASCEDAATRALAPLSDLMTRSPLGFARALSCVDMLVNPSVEVAIAGDPAEDSCRDMIDVVATRFLPNVALAAAIPGSRAASVVPLMEDRLLVRGRCAAYVCERFICDLPITDPAALAERLFPDTLGRASDVGRDRGGTDDNRDIRDQQR